MKAMMKAIWKDQILAESGRTIVIEGNHYFPPDSIRREFFVRSDTKTTCPWKGVASYFHISVGNDRNNDSAWTYPEPKPAAAEIKDHVAFWKGVEVVS